MKRSCLKQNAEKQRDCVSWRVSWYAKYKKSKKIQPQRYLKNRIKHYEIEKIFDSKCSFNDSDKKNIF